MMNLVVDIGNTSIKCGIFKERELQISKRVTGEIKKVIGDLIEEYQVEEVILSASGRGIEEVQNILNKTQCKILILSPDTPLPIKIIYETPETLGRDRIAGMVAAWRLFPDETSLVIDMGTCITTNIINKKGEFLGGTISPGVSMRARAMHEYTASLPLIELELPKSYIGTNTVSSMQNGVLRGTYFEIQSLIDQYKPVFNINNVILTGGDAKFFVNLLNFQIFAHPNLVLTGLNEILLYNL